jgi:ABC-2 type transport system ATP-binding protein
MCIIEIHEATKKYKEEVVLDSVSLRFDEGLIHGIVGRNGSGKTMLFRAICGFVPLTSGRILVDGKQIGKDLSIPESLGIIIEAPGFLPNYSAYQNLKLLADIKRIATRETIRETLRLVGLDSTGRKHVGKFSMGMRQRLGIAQAIMENPDLLILDEPFNGLDASGVDEMRELLLGYKASGKTILVASHSTEDIRLLCDTEHRMDKGRVISSR